MWSRHNAIECSHDVKGGMGKRKATSEPLVREPNELTDPVVSWLGERLGSVPTVTPNVPSAPSNQVVVSGNSTSLALATSAGSRSHVGFERFVNGLGVQHLV